MFNAKKAKGVYTVSGRGQTVSAKTLKELEEETGILAQHLSVLFKYQDLNFEITEEEV